MNYAKSAEYRLTQIDAPANRRIPMKLLCLAAICMGLAISGCDLGTVDASAEKNLKEENKMESIQITTTTQPKIPPIDAAVAAEFETATFAMG